MRSPFPDFYKIPRLSRPAGVILSFPLFPRSPEHARAGLNHVCSGDDATNANKRKEPGSAEKPGKRAKN
jgi:hypothetical protein